MCIQYTGQLYPHGSVCTEYRSVIPHGSVYTVYRSVIPHGSVYTVYRSGVPHGSVYTVHRSVSGLTEWVSGIRHWARYNRDSLCSNTSAGLVLLAISRNWWKNRYLTWQHHSVQCLRQHTR